MKTFFLTTAATILLASTATAIIVPGGDAPQVSYILDTPVGRIVMTCTEPQATTASASASTAFPVLLDTGPVVIGAEPGECVFAPASD